MRAVPIGTQASYTLVVAAEHLASRFKDPMLPPVFATPMMILAMENAALEAIKPFFEPGESAVGSHVDVRHLAATPVGRRVTAWAVVTQVSGRRIAFRVWALDGDEQVGAGTHERVLIDLARFNQGLARKAAGGASQEEA
jgi:fluoroacetyl-CoA thioesterase